MVANGMRVDPDTGAPEPRHRKHIQELWGIFCSFVQGRPTGGLLHKLPPYNPFATWSHHDRYASSDHFDANVVTPHRDAARQVRQFYLHLKVDGHV